MPNKKTVFSNAWLSLPNYSTWLYAVQNDKFSAGCKFCNSTFSLSNMGKQALTSHLKSKKHLSIMKSMKSCSTVKMFIASPTENTESASIQIDSLKETVKPFLLSEEVTKSEIVWCLHAAIEHMSFRSAARALSTFKIMFPDSSIASKMQLQRTKVAYTLVHGLAPYFKRKLVTQLEKADHIVVGFDESLNKISMKQQMDLFVRFWDNDKKEVNSRYFASVFLGHTCAGDILEGFKIALNGLCLKKITQISMDGPNVNFKFLSDLCKELQTSPSEPILLDLGSCGLHTLHCAFKAAFNGTQWDIVCYLRALYNLFKDVPARRADYTKHTSSELFPKKFCAIRWAENAQVVQRAMEIHQNVKKFITAVEKKKDQPSCKSYQIVSSYIKDDLLLPKLTFFETMAVIIEPFIVEFQGEAPLAPFLYESIKNLLKSVLSRIVKQDVLHNTPSITDVDVCQVKNLKNTKEIDVGYAVRAALKKSKSSPIQVDNFFKSCRTALQKFVQKLFERSPIKYKLTRGISCLDPEVAVNETIATKRLSLCLNILVSHNQVSGNEADKIDFQYKNIIQKTEVIALLKSYNRSTRLDHFWMNIIDSNNGYAELKKFFQFVLILSHGNAAVERGFSINKECLLYNQAEESLVAIRLVHDAIISAGGVSSVDISKELIHAARNAHTFYKESLKNKEKKETKDKQIENEKKRTAAKMKELQLQKMKLLADTEKKASLIDEQIKSLK